MTIASRATQISDATMTARTKRDQIVKIIVGIRRSATYTVSVMYDEFGRSATEAATKAIALACFVVGMIKAMVLVIATQKFFAALTVPGLLVWDRIMATETGARYTLFIHCLGYARELVPTAGRALRVAIRCSIPASYTEAQSFAFSLEPFLTVRHLCKTIWAANAVWCGWLSTRYAKPLLAALCTPSFGSDTTLSGAICTICSVCYRWVAASYAKAQFLVPNLVVLLSDIVSLQAIWTAFTVRCCRVATV